MSDFPFASTHKNRKKMAARALRTAVIRGFAAAQIRGLAVSAVRVSLFVCCEGGSGGGRSEESVTERSCTCLARLFDVGLICVCRFVCVCVSVF